MAFPAFLGVQSLGQKKKKKPTKNPPTNQAKPNQQKNYTQKYARHHVLAELVEAMNIYSFLAVV